MDLHEEMSGVVGPEVGGHLGNPLQGIEAARGEPDHQCSVLGLGRGGLPAGDRAGRRFPAGAGVTGECAAQR